MMYRQDVRNVTQDSLHKNVGVIPQDPSLFHRVLMENIRYSKADASDDEVVEATKRCRSYYNFSVFIFFKFNT